MDGENNGKPWNGWFGGDLRILGWVKILQIAVGWMTNLRDVEIIESMHADVDSQ